MILQILFIRMRQQTNRCPTFAQKQEILRESEVEICTFCIFAQNLKTTTIFLKHFHI